VSAEHGLVKPDEGIEAYDTTLDDLSDEEHRAWLSDVSRDLWHEHIEMDIDRWTILAGGKYYRELDRMMWRMKFADFDAPTAGKPIGERMEWLSDELDEQNKEAIV